MATKKYVSDSKLQYFWNKIKTFVNNNVPTRTSQLTNDSNFIDTSYKLYATDDNNGTVTIHFGTIVNE